MKRLFPFLIYISTFILLLGIFWAISTIFLDPDFGWHLKMGELINTSGIPKTDPFSYTMPSFPFIDHEWLTDLIIFKLYPLIGFNGLAFLSALIITLTLLIVSPLNVTPFSLTLILASTASLFIGAGTRPQILSWFLFALLFRILFTSSWWEKGRFFLPLIFLLWVNLHGGFALGLIVLLVFIFFKWQAKQLNRKDAMLAAVSLLVTLINPYGSRIWEEIFRTGSDISLHWKISEWTPTFSSIDAVLLIFMAFSLALVWFYRRKIPPVQQAIYLILLIAAFSSKRQVPFWVIFNLPLTFRLGNDLFSKAINPLKTQRVFLFAAFALFWAQTTILFSTIQTWSENSFYPVKAIAYLQSHPYQEHLFAPYDWGGYLIWKLPKSKTFIDGRMPSWKQQTTDNKESQNAFAEYTRIITTTANPETALNRYRVHTVLWETADIKSEFIQVLIKDGWKEVYQDQAAVIFTNS